MSETLSNMPQHDPIIDSMGRLVKLIFGPDRATRARTGVILLCALMYAICCSAAFYAAEVGMMRDFAPKLLLLTTIPCYTAFYVLVRTGRTRTLRDPNLMIPQQSFSLLAIAFAYTAIGPHDRGLVLVLIALVMVFGMYTHQPRQAAFAGVLAMVLLAMCMGVLSHIDPVYYPPTLELLRFELMIGTLPPLILAAYQISAWRNRLAQQRRELRDTLEKVQTLASRDALTGLYNRRHMQDRLVDSAKRHERYGERFTVVLVDLDHFKRINDVHGHRVGDEALMAFASAATLALRESDTVGRWGGEEFLFILPNTSPTKALVALDRLRAALQHCSISSRVPGLRVAFSAGIAQHDVAAPVHRTLERADHALYQAKTAGRNRSLVSPSDPR
ncbi:GGDEF domain-containing protein [Aquabacterium parvum]|jgi:diguanylate cyclase (GGDEF)-like protein|uniref:GGDEF domain-containing protein n=1 Tax=Aquabacterium parvum TaxID=70584 RepID=UPI000718E3C2|nr:diguanylate cyclase [Aquabacterium parvum]MBU0916047.1 diguanylate cyclase [Gammaproteobacteria bacterium]